MNLFNNPKLNLIKFWRFVGVGVFSATLDISAFWYFLEILETNLFIATSLSYFLTFFVNYYSHAFLTFKVKPTILSLMKFSVSVFINYLLSLLIVLGGIFVFEEPIIWKLIALIFVAISGFVLGQFWTFKNDGNT